MYILNLIYEAGTQISFDMKSEKSNQGYKISSSVF